MLIICKGVAICKGLPQHSSWEPGNLRGEASFTNGT